VGVTWLPSETVLDAANLESSLALTSRRNSIDIIRLVVEEDANLGGSGMEESSAY